MVPCCWFFWALWLLLMHAVAAAEEQVEAGCSALAKSCGNLTISHPFWLDDWETGRSCGSSGFEVTCFNNSSSVLLSSKPTGFGFAC